MSFSFVRHKNGREIPIKVSLWDAFRSESSLKRAYPKGPKKNPQSTDPASEPPAPETATPALTTDTKKGSTSEEEVYSPQDDAKLIELKNEKKTWAEILQALGKASKPQAQKRWNQIRPKDEDAKKKEEGMRKAKEAREKKEAKEAEDEARAAERKMEEEARAGPNPSVSQGKASEGVETASANDSLRRFLARHERDKWLAVASRHYDLTGQRITPAMAKRLAQTQLSTRS